MWRHCHELTFSIDRDLAEHEVVLSWDVHIQVATNSRFQTFDHIHTATDGCALVLATASETRVSQGVTVSHWWSVISQGDQIVFLASH